MRLRTALFALSLAVLIAAAPAGAAVKPRFGKSVLLKPVSGSVLVKEPGSKQRRLREASRVKLGVRVDTTNGKVKLTSALPSGERQSASFNGAPFVVTQPRGEKGLTDLRLAADLQCEAGSARAARSSRLFGKGHGRFRTRGRSSSATVRGTTWVTEDDCTATEITSVEGEVETQADGVDLSRLLEPGQTVSYYCNTTLKVSSIPYCVLLLSDPADAIFGMGIIGYTDQTDYRLCITYPDGVTEECFDVPLTEPDADGLRQSTVACYARPGPGSYTVRWALGGETLFPALSTPPVKGADVPQPACGSDPPPREASRAPARGGAATRTGSHGSAALGLAPAFRPIGP